MLLCQKKTETISYLLSEEQETETTMLKFGAMQQRLENLVSIRISGGETRFFLAAYKLRLLFEKKGTIFFADLPNFLEKCSLFIRKNCVEVMCNVF